MWLERYQANRIPLTTSQGAKWPNGRVSQGFEVNTTEVWNNSAEWRLPQFCESCCPVRLRLFRGSWLGGVCWFPSSQSSCMAAFVIVACFVLFGLTAIPIQRMTPWMIQCYHLSSSYRRCGTDQLISLPFLFCRLLLFVWFVLFLLWLVFLVLFVLFVFFLLAS